MLLSRAQRDTPSAHRSFVMRRVIIALVTLTCILVGPATGSALAQKPVNNLAPEVVGTALPGETLVCGAGSWSGAVSEFRYEWQRDGIAAGSKVTYVITTADEGHSVWCVVTAIGSEGSTEAVSGNSLTIPGGKLESLPENTLAPEVLGRPVVGETVSCSQGKWNGSPRPTFSYEWVRDEGPGETTIASASTSEYKIVSEDEGHSLACRVTANNSAGSASKLSSNSLRIPGTKPEEKVPPRVLGIEPAGVGEPLTCSPGTWSETPAPTFTYQWLRDGASIASATGSTYTVEPADQVHSLSCKVIATNSVGSAEALSSNSVEVAGSKPENTIAPRVSGIPAVGETLTCETGTWTGVPPATFAYQWVRDQDKPDEEAIGSAIFSTYTATIEDRGRSLSCEVIATNGEGSASRMSEGVVVPAGTGGTAPENILAPAVSGSAALGARLTCLEGTWSGSPVPALTYQWLRDGSSIESATAGTYVVVEADQGHSLSCRVAAINDEGAAYENSSNVLEIPGTEPQDIEAPEVSGTPAVGESLICLRGTWSGKPTPTFTYRWLRDGTSIPSATASSHTVTSEDRGTSISCMVIAGNSAGVGEAASSNTLEVPGGGPQSRTPPEVSGIPSVGNTLTCSPGTWTGEPAPTYSYQWLLDGVDLSSATSDEYTVASADRGLVLTCEVTASNREGAQSANSVGLHVPGVRPEDVEAPQVSGTPAVGQQLTCLRGIWKGEPPPTFTYQWARDGTSIASATSATYAVELADQGHVLSCEVTATNSEGTAEAESSNGLAISRGVARTESSPQLTAPVFAAPSTPTTAQILAALRAQLTRAQKRARIASLRKKPIYAFSFTAPAVGKLELFWYQTPSEAHRSANTKPLELALTTTSFATASTETVDLHLTAAGRRLIRESRRIDILVKGVFASPHASPVTWLKTVALS